MMVGIMQKGLDKKKRERIIEALQANPNAKLVASEIGGVSQTTVWKIANAEGIKLTAGKAASGKKPSPDRRASIVAALQANPNAKLVANEIGGVNRATVWRIAKAHGIELTAGKAARRRSLSSDRRASIVAALRANPNAQLVASDIGGVSRTTVWKIAKAQGIELTAAGKAASRRSHKAERITAKLTRD
jgi:hypothetical protein